MDRSAAGDAGALTRRIVLGGRPVEYRFARRARRTLGLRIDARGLSVAAPWRMPWPRIEAFLLAKSGWILRKLAAWSAAGAPRTLRGASGETLPYFGAELTLLAAAGPAGVTLEGASLRVRHPAPHREGAVLAVLQAWLRARTHEAFAPRAAEYAGRLGLEAPPVTISGARRQWGACTADGRIRLAWRLALLEPELGDYVVAHEVAHLVEMTHSPRFWSAVEWLYPRWREARGRIRRAAAALPRFGGDGDGGIR